MSLRLVILLAATPFPAFASQSVELKWQPSPSPDITGYDVYYGGSPSECTNEISAGDVTNLTVSGLADATTYYFEARAVNSLGLESGFSVETNYAIPTAAAILGEPLLSSNGVSIAVSGIPDYPYVVEASTDLVSWVTLGTNAPPFLFTDTNALQYPKRFYRAVYYQGGN